MDVYRLSIDATLDRAYDRYGFIRDAFLQRRLYQVFDGNPPESLLFDPLDEFDEELDDELESGPGLDPAPESGADPEPPVESGQPPD